MLKLYGKKDKKLTVDLSTVNELKENDKILIASNGKMKQIDQDLVNIGGGIHLSASTPPALEAGSFDSVTEDCKIYIPTGSLEAYSSASNWSNYASMLVEE